MSPAIRRSRPPLRSCACLCGLIAGLSACDSGITGSPAELFPVRMYGTGFEHPSFVPGLLDGQDGWFAGLGQGAITVSGQPQARQGQQGLRIDGSKLQEFFGFFLGSYVRPLNYVPSEHGTPFVVVSGYLKLSAQAPPTTGLALALTGAMNGEYTANIQIGVREQDGQFISYMSNYDGVFVNGPSYDLGEWTHVRAVFDFERRTVHGFFNGTSMGEVPFTNGIDEQAAFVNIAIGGNQPLGNVVASVDNLSVVAARVWPLPE